MARSCLLTFPILYQETGKPAISDRFPLGGEILGSLNILLFYKLVCGPLFKLYSKILQSQSGTVLFCA